MPGPRAAQNVPPPGTDKVGKCPAVARGRVCWAQLELTDALFQTELDYADLITIM